MTTWSESNLLRVAELVDAGMGVATIGMQLGLTYTEAKRYVELTTHRLALPYVTVRLTHKEVTK